MPEKKKTNLKRFKDVAAKDVVFNNPRADREFPMHAPDPEYINKKMLYDDQKDDNNQLSALKNEYLNKVKKRMQKRMLDRKRVSGATGHALFRDP